MSRKLAVIVPLGLALTACSGDPAAISTTTEITETSTSTTSGSTETASVPATTTVPPSTTTTLVVTIPSTPAVATVLSEFSAATGGVAADTRGNIYFADMGPAPARVGHRVFKMTPGGTVSLLADTNLIRGASGLAVDDAGVVYQSGFTSGNIVRISSDGRVEEFASTGIRGPIGIVIDPRTGGLFVADCRAGRIVAVDTQGTSSTHTQDPLLNCPNGITMDDDGMIYVANFGDGRVLAVTPDGKVSELAELPGRNLGHLAFADGILYVAARGAHQIWTVTLDGEATILAGNGGRDLVDGSLADAEINLPNGVAITSDGVIWINQPAVSTGANHPIALRRIDPDQ